MQNFYFYSTAIQFEFIFSRVPGGLADFFGAEADFFCMWLRLLLKVGKLSYFCIHNFDIYSL